MPVVKLGWVVYPWQINTLFLCHTQKNPSAVQERGSWRVSKFQLKKSDTWLLRNAEMREETAMQDGRVIFCCLACVRSCICRLWVDLSFTSRQHDGLGEQGRLVLKASWGLWFRLNGGWGLLLGWVMVENVIRAALRYEKTHVMSCSHWCHWYRYKTVMSYSKYITFYGDGGSSFKTQ